MAKKKKRAKKKKSGGPVAVSAKTDRQYQVEQAARTLVESEEVRADKALLAAAKRELAKQKAALGRAIGKG